MRAKPIRIQFDESKSLRTVVRDVIIQAEDRQKTMPGVDYTGAVLRHLVRAKIDCVLGQGELVGKGSISEGLCDFLLGDVAVHVTTSPGEAVIERCRDNLRDGYRPVLITLQRRVTVGEGLASNAGLADQIDFFEVEQFLALNVYLAGRFVAGGRRKAVHEIIKRYNGVVERFETDLTLKIELRL